MNLNNLRQIAETDGMTKYEHPSDNVVAYEFHQYDNEPVLFVKNLGREKAVMIHTNGSPTTMRTNSGTFEDALTDGRTMMKHYAQ